ncbi:MAG TPA: LamG-like jellyroll fold domain-containing protein [Bacteroidales bacterium]|nr:LamG-like jellyroll fold domain-containing protein [Bacteroidales bacterium]
MNKRILHYAGIMLFALSLFSGTILAQTCPTGLIGYWKMNELTGLTHIDSYAGHNATSNNQIVADEYGIVGTARVFNTTSTYEGDKATIASNSAFNFAAQSSFSFVYWFKTNDKAYNGDDHIIISRGNWHPTAAYWSSGINGSGKINFILYDSDLKYGILETTDGKDYADGEWHQVAFVRNNSTDMDILYVDGHLNQSISVDHTGNFAISEPIQIANLLSGGEYHYFFKGSVDEIAIYNRALSEAEILDQHDNAHLGIGICDGPNAVFSSNPKVTATVGMPYTYTVHAGGKNPITYSLLKAPAGMTMDASGVISWTPASITADGLVKVRAVNSYPPADTQTFRINIAQGTACPSNLTFLLKLNEANGPNYADYYGNHNATSTGSPTPIAGKVGTAQNFSSGTRIDIPDNSTEFEWDGASSFSMEVWVKPANVVTSGMVALGRINIDGGIELSEWQLGVTPTGYANFELFDNHKNLGSTGSILTGTSLLTDGNWHHLVAVRDGSTNTNRLYVDGELEDSEIISYSYSFKSDVQPNPMNLGYIKRASGSSEEYHFIGGIDEAAVFSKALTQAEVTSFYNNGNPVGHCSEGNFAPVITSDPVTNGAEDVLYTYHFTVDDYDATDTLTLSAITKPSWLTFSWTPHQKTATLSGTPNSSQVGNHNVTLRVTDNHVQVNQSFTIAIANVNDPPVVSSVAVTTANEDALYSYTLTVTDNDVNDVIGMSVVSKPSWLNFAYTPGNKSAVLSGTPDDANIGSGDVDISITDGHETIHHSYTLVVSAVNDLPVIISQSTLSTNEDVAFTLSKSSFTITDEDNTQNELSIEVRSGTNYTSVGNTVTPAANYSGELSVNLVAKDGTGESAVFHALVTVNPVNDAPVVTSAPSLTGYVGTLYAYIFIASDVDNASLVYSVVEKPAWLQFSAETGVLTGTPAAGDKGDNLVILKVSDGTNDVEQNFVIAVDGPDAVQNLESAGIRIYPVPAREYMNVSLDMQKEDTYVEIYSLSGSLALQNVIPSGQTLYKIDFRGLKAGMYFLKIHNNTLNNFGRFTIIE